MGQSVLELTADSFRLYLAAMSLHCIESKVSTMHLWRRRYINAFDGAQCDASVREQKG